jgi:hypothetical protein
MKVRIYPSASNAVEIDGVIFNTPEAVDRFIRALVVAKNAVWKPEPKK